MDYNFNIPGYNGLRFNPQMPLVNTNSGMNPIQAPMAPTQNFSGAMNNQPQMMDSHWQFGLNYGHIAMSQAIQGLGAYLRQKNQAADFKSYNKVQSNPLLQIPNNPNTSQQSQYGENQFKKGGLKKKVEGGENPFTLDSIRKAKESGWKDTQLVDDVNILLSGKGKFPQGYDGDEQKLLMSAYIWNQQNKSRGPEESINSFFNSPVDNNNTVDVLRQRLNKIGYGAGSMYNSTPNVDLNKKAEGGFSDFDDFNEEDFQDLKDQMDRYFNEKGQKTPNVDIEDKDEVLDTKTETNEPDQEQSRNNKSLDFLMEPDEQEEETKQPNEEGEPTQYIQAPPLDLKASSMPDQSNNNFLQAFKNGIAKVENANYSEGNKYSSAFGKYQFTSPTLEAVRENHFPNIPKKDFVSTYKSDSNFQERVMDAYGSYLLSKFGDPHKAATAFFLGEGKANFYNQPDYKPTPNNLTVGKYLQNFDKGYKFNDGGRTPEQEDPDVKNVKNFYNDYINSPNYLKRLKGMNYPDPNSIIRERLNQINNSTFTTIPNHGSEYDNNTNKVTYDPEEIKKFGFNKEDTIAHEYGHAAGALMYGEPTGLNNKEVDILTKRNKFTDYPIVGMTNSKSIGKILHDGKASELKANIDAFRYRLKKDGLYDTGTQEFNQNTLNAAKEKYGDNKQYEGLFYQLSDKDFIYLMNNIASNNYKSSNQAHRGGHIMNKPEGMMLPFNPQMKMEDGGTPPKPKYNIPNAYLFDMLHPGYTPTAQDSTLYRQTFEAAQKNPAAFNYQQMNQAAMNNYLVHNELGYDQNRTNYLRDANKAAAVWDAQHPHKKGGQIYEEGGEYDLTNDQIKQLKKQGYKIEIL